MNCRLHKTPWFPDTETFMDIPYRKGSGGDLVRPGIHKAPVYTTQKGKEIQTWKYIKLCNIMFNQ